MKANMDITQQRGCMVDNITLEDNITHSRYIKTGLYVGQVMKTIKARTHC